MIPRYLVARRQTLKILANRTPNALASSMPDKVPDGSQLSYASPYVPPDLRHLFPNLIVLFLRRQENDFTNDDSEEDSEEIEPSVITKEEAIIYRPIKLSTLVAAAVIGTDRRDTFIASNAIGFSRNFTDIFYWHSWINPRVSVKKTRVRDEIVVIKFEQTSRFLPEPAARYEIENHDENYELDLKVYFTQDDEWPEDVKRDTVRAILSLVAPRPANNVDQFPLPNLELEGNKVPLDIFMDEVGAVDLKYPW
jgi:hypothetical protein